MLTLAMNTDIKLIRLFQLISPSLPIGSYTYSQGIEWAVEQGWVQDENELQEWLTSILQTTMLYLDVPLLIRFIKAWSENDKAALDRWNEYLLASRETAELRLEESNRARAFSQVIISLDPGASEVKQQLLQSQHACFSYACCRWDIPVEHACTGMLWSWLENQVLSAVKIIPLGQTAGQQLLFKLAGSIPQIIQQAQTIKDDHLGASPMALAIASSRHETQYTRLFRS